MDMKSNKISYDMPQKLHRLQGNWERNVSHSATQSSILHHFQEYKVSLKMI